MSSRLKSAIVDFVLVTAILTILDIFIIGGMSVSSTLLNIILASTFAMVNYELLYKPKPTKVINIDHRDRVE